MKKKIIELTLLNMIIAFFIIALNDNAKIFIKYLIFGEFTNIEKIKDQSKLDLKIGRKFNKITPLNRKLFDEKTIKDLNKYKSQCEANTNINEYNFTKYDCLAQLISIKSVPSFNNVCLKTYDLKERIKLVRSGNSCCSDAVESFTLHSNAIGLKVREFHTRNHTFAEYFDPTNNKWKVIDIYYKKIFFDKNKNLLTSFSLFDSKVRPELIIYSYANVKKGYDFDHFIPINNQSFLAYKLGNDILPTYEFQERLPKFLPIFFKKFLSHLIGVNPNYLIISQNKFFYSYKILFYVIVLLIFVLECHLIFSLKSAMLENFKK